MTFPLAVQTTYQDLLESHRMQAVSVPAGTPFLKTKKSGRYWYTRQRIGERVVDRYLGRDSEELRKRVERAKAGQETQRVFVRRCSLLGAQLKAAGLPTLDRNTGKVLRAMARVGTFRLGGTLVGTHAFRLYSAELGVRLDHMLAVTEDIDIAAFENLKLVIEEQVAPPLAETFRALGLQPAPGLDPKRRPTRWVMPGGGTMVDFIVPKMKQDSEVLLLKPLGVYAQALSFLSYLIADPIAAVGLYREGVLVQVPQPARFAIHKLIVAQRRAGQAKKRKDLAQAEALIDVLAEDQPVILQEAYEDALGRGSKWRSALAASLKERPAMRERLMGL